MRIYTLDWRCPTATSVQVFGITENGKKVSKIVAGFKFRFWVQMPDAEHISDLHGVVRQMRARAVDVQLETERLGSIEIEKMRGTDQVFARIMSESHEELRKVGRQLKMQTWPDGRALQTFEVGMDPVTRFLQVLNIDPHGWIQVPLGESIRVNDIFPCKTKTGLPTALCVAAFDIECLSDDCRSFPDALNPNDRCEQIGLVMEYPFGDGLERRVMFTLQSLPACSGTVVVECESERMMFAEFERYVHEHVHILTNYNGFGFDYPYLIVRCSIPEERVLRKEFTTAAFGTQDTTMVTFDGVLQLDVLMYLRKNKKLESYKLDDVAALYLKQSKHAVSPAQIFDSLKRGSEADRGVVADYCLQDCCLVLRLMGKFSIVRSLFAMCSVTFCPFSKMTISGQQARTLDLLSRYMLPRKLLMPDRRHDLDVADEKYEGATVLEAQSGLYRDAVGALDFASLYPSIMIAMNLCVSTRHAGVPSDPDQFNLVNDIYYRKSPVGVIPEVLQYLWNTRKSVRRAMKSETCQNTLANMEAEQLSYKLVMNSIYGFLGSSFTPIETKSIARSVTWYGRYLLQQTQKVLLENFSNARIVYGDSVTGDTLVRTEGGWIPIEAIGSHWRKYRHPNLVQQAMGRLRSKRVSLPDSRVVLEPSGAECQHVIRRHFSGDIYKVTFSDGHVLKITGDHCIWYNGRWISARELRPGMIVG